MDLNFFKIIDKGTKAVPATKYAVGILGLAAVVAVIRQFRLDWAIALWGTIILLGLMILLVVFARLTETSPEEFKGPVKVLMWSFVILFICNCILLSASAFTGYPQLHSLFYKPDPVSIKKDTASISTKPLVPAGNKVEIHVDSSPQSTVIVGDSNKVGNK